MAGNGGGGTGPGDPCGNVVANLIVPISERLSFLTEKQREQAEVLSEVEEYIDSLDALEQQVMRLRYFRRFTWDAICDSERYSRATACRLHSSAVAKCKSDFYKSMIQNETL
jgi:DNA-directed RNA polymerase specialized sigma subunit